MKSPAQHITTFRSLIVKLTLLIALLFPTLCQALGPKTFASESKLKEGKWIRIEVEKEGMHFLSFDALRKMGFNNPQKVNVYGYGGQLLSEELDGNIIDDLPLLLSTSSKSGLVFFARSTTGWSRSSGKMQFERTRNHYSAKSYYFLSDIPVSDLTPRKAEPVEFSAGQPVTTFREHLLHEQDILSPAPSGRTYLGEDFRTQTSRSFKFHLPGITGDAKTLICFGAKVSNGSSSIIISANGIPLPSASSDIIPGISSSLSHLNTISTVKTVPEPGENLSITINFSYSGVIFTGALDYIQIEYDRMLKLKDGELLFSLNPTQTTEVKIEGCNSNTKIWNVGQPGKEYEIPFRLEESYAYFTVKPGEGEYIAFNPEKILQAPTSPVKVNNQNLHSLKAPDLLIVTPGNFRNAADKIAALHRNHDNMTVEVVTPESIYNEFSSGSPDPTAIRRLLKMWHDRETSASGKRMHCLLLGRPTYDHLAVTTASRNRSVAPIPIWQSPDCSNEVSSYSTDDYIGMLDDNPRKLDMATAIIHVAIGRMPVTTVYEADAAADKLVKYVSTPQRGAWRNTILTIADDQDSGEHLFQAEKAINAMQSDNLGKCYRYEKLYLDAYPLVNSGIGPSYPSAKKRFIDMLDTGVALVNYMGHASTRELTADNFFSWTDISSLKNTRLPFMFATTCDFLKWDADEISGGEKMWLYPEYGIIGMLCPSRKTIVPLNGNFSKNTLSNLFPRDETGYLPTLGYAAVKGKNATKGETNRLRYAFMGDPALRLPEMKFNVTADSVGDKTVGLPEEIPVVGCGERVSLSGVVENIGNGADANGILDIVLYDAETTVETLGNGTDGEVCTFNDRNSKLFIGKAQVKNGRWKSEIIIPSETSGNFSPALLSFYYADDSGDEGNGFCDQLIVYGNDDNTESDDVGPAITDFHLDRPSFRNGDAVSPSPVVHASFIDPSGINVSNTGIGHGISLVLDGETNLGNIQAAYVADVSTPESGSITYQLNGIEPGEHTVKLTVWDNAGNSSSEQLDFKVEASWRPSIIDVSTDLSTASSYVTFILSTDGTDNLAESKIEVFDIGGRLVWEGNFNTTSQTSSIVWNLHDFGNRRVPRGIYIYRAIAKSASGAESSKSKKLAVTAK